MAVKGHSAHRFAWLPPFCPCLLLLSCGGRPWWPFLPRLYRKLGSTRKCFKDMLTKLQGAKGDSTLARDSKWLRLLPCFPLHPK